MLDQKQVRSDDYNAETLIYNHRGSVDLPPDDTNLNAVLNQFAQNQAEVNDDDYFTEADYIHPKNIALTAILFFVGLICSILGSMHIANGGPVLSLYFIGTLCLLPAFWQSRNMYRKCIRRPGLDIISMHATI